jgi:nitronate monooxygenase
MVAMSTEELIELLNTLLEAERAGAKTLAAFLDEYPPRSASWEQVRSVQHDEAANCKLLIDALHSIGGVPSKATGDFLGKALAQQGTVARLNFLNRGQGWVARAIAAALPRLADGPVRRMLADMHASHLANIDACNALLPPAARH